MSATVTDLTAPVDGTHDESLTYQRGLRRDYMLWLNAVCNVWVPRPCPSREVFK